MTIILSIVVIIYFVIDQFEYSLVHRFSFWLLPLFTCYLFMKTFVYSPLNLGLAVALAIFAAAVSYFQAAATQIRQEKRIQLYFENDQHEEVPVYRRVVTSQGGRRYLEGWLLVLLVQIIIEVTYLNKALSVHNVWEIVWTEIIGDLLTTYRFATASSHTSWILWALMGFTSLGYTLWLSRRSPEVHEAIFQKNA